MLSLLPHARYCLCALMMTFTSATAVAQSRCLIEGTHDRTEVVVAPDEIHEPFVVTAHHARLAVDTASERRGAVHVEGALAFDGELELSSLRLSLLSSSYEHGELVIHPNGAEMKPVRVDIPGESMVVRLTLSREAYMTTAIPCASLIIGHMDSAPTEMSVSGDGTFWRPRRGPLVLRTGPSAAVAATIHGPVEVERVARHGGWQRVLVRGNRAHVLGWCYRAA